MVYKAGTGPVMCVMALPIHLGVWSMAIAAYYCCSNPTSPWLLSELRYSYRYRLCCNLTVAERG